MDSKTVSEFAFESFCISNEILFERVAENSFPTPDYLVTIGNGKIYFEIKQIDKDPNFSGARQTRIPGTHVRSKINDARNQVRTAQRNGIPAVLLVYNNLDPLQFFGTEPHDFLAAMYGELTILASRTPVSAPGIFHGRNMTLRKDKNTSFSAVGWLYKSQHGAAIILYENVFATVPLDYEALPQAIEYNRVQFEDDADK